MQDNQDSRDIKSRRRHWEEQVFRPALAKARETGFSPPELPTEPIYTPEDVSGLNYLDDLGFPGEYPYTRGIFPTMYLGRLWTMRQYAGFGTPEETNERFRYLLSQGQTGLLVAVDLPTQLGYDSDDPRAEGEVGRVGVAVDSLQDMELIFNGLPLEKASPATTMNALPGVWLALYLAVAEKAGLPLSHITGTTQNDILKEFLARGTYIFPPHPSLRLTVDVIEFCSRHLPRWNFINICGYHLREAGSTLVQEVAFAIANAITYVQAAIDRGLEVDSFAPRLAFNFSAFTNLFQESAKFRATRRLWARIMRERFQAKNPASWMWRAGAGSGGSTLVAQQPENNIVRITLHALAGILGGVQSFHTAAYDEALAIPTEKSALLALRTQQVLAYESGVAEVIDPLAGSYYVESLTNRIEEEVNRYLDKIEAQGGMIAAIESGWARDEIAQTAWEHQKQQESGGHVIVGVNRFADGETQLSFDLHQMDPTVVDRQKKRLIQLRKQRNNTRVNRALAELRKEARGTGNLMYPIIEAVKSCATLGEVTSVLREVFGEYREGVKT